MSMQDLRNKYDRHNTKSSIKKAIQKELPGGSQVLHALQLMEDVLQIHQQHQSSNLAQVNSAIDSLQKCLALYEQEIRFRYEAVGAAT